MVEPQTDSIEHPLKFACTAWGNKLALARKHKRDEFDYFADEGMAFYVGADKANTVWKKHMRGSGDEGSGADGEDLEFQFVLAKVAELVQIYGPNLYHRNPVRNVTARMLPQIPIDVIGNPQDPNVQQIHAQMNQQQAQVGAMAKARAQLMETYLNFTPNELDLKSHSRKAINETLIKGAGVLWTETYQSYPGSHTLVGSFYDTIDNLQVDPDAEEFDDAQWISRTYHRSVRLVAQEYGLDEEELRIHANVRSGNSQAEGAAAATNYDDNENDDIKRGKTNDQITYTKIYSRMGMGDHLSGVSDEHRGTLDDFGQNVMLVVTKGVPYPLNLPTELLERAATDPEAFDEAFQRVQWPIPFWMDKQFPCTILAFHEIPNHVWPMAHIRPGLPELKFLNWTTSYLAQNAKHTSRLYAQTFAGEDQENKDKLTGGKGFTVIEVSQSSDMLKDVFKFQSPPNGTGADLLEINAEINDQFEKRTGLNEMAYGGLGGIRSATEAEIKKEATNVRPDDMANRVEDWMSLVSRKEALACQWLLEPEDIAPILGPAGAQMWEQLIMSADVGQLALEFDYRIEAGSARKPNKDAKIYNMQQVFQVLMPLIVPVSQETGDVSTVNAVMQAWAKANDIENAEQFMLQPPPPPQPDPAEQQRMQMEQQKMQMEMQKLQVELQKMQMELQGKSMDQQAQQMSQQMEMQIKRLDAQLKQAELAMKGQEHAQGMGFDEETHDQEFRQSEETHDQEYRHEESKSALALEIMKKMGDAKAKQAALKPAAGSKT